MKMVMYLIATLFLGMGVSNANNIESDELNLIDGKQDSINLFIKENRKSKVYRHDSRDIYDIATEGDSIYRLAGAVLNRYYQGEVLLKAIATFEGDREDLISEYYYSDEKVFFVLKTRIEYSSPKWSDNEKEIEKKVSTNKYYFIDGSLAVWLNSDNKKLTKQNACDAFVKAETSILKDAKLYAKLLQTRYIETE